MIDNVRHKFIGMIEWKLLHYKRTVRDLQALKRLLEQMEEGDYLRLVDPAEQLVLDLIDGDHCDQDMLNELLKELARD
jgi:hypothetical protein